MVILTLFLGCNADFTLSERTPTPQPAPDGSAPPAEASVKQLDPVDLLTRISIDLRGVRPSVAELEAVEADPAVLDAMIAEWLADERFGDQVRRLFADAYLTRQDYFYVTAADYGLSDEPGFAAAVGEEPLQILSAIAVEDRPYSEVVTADWTMANEVLGAAWPLDYPEGETGWRRVQYTDGRPTAGVLTTNSMWWRYMSAASNANRGRANAVSKILLCTDYLSKPIEFDRSVNILDGGALADALQNNPGCVACHYSLDPFAAYFWGFYYYDYASMPETTSYHAERERMWEDYSGVAPGYYGEAGYTLNDLGRQISEDPRLYSCAVERVYGGLLQRELGLDDTAALLDHLAAFEGEGYTLRALYRSVVAGEEYRAAPSEDPRAASRKQVTPELLASMVEDLTGFRFTYYGYDMMMTDTYGLRTLAGGVDGQFVTSPAEEPTATLVLVQERLAEAAAHYVVQADRANPGSARLFTEIGFVETPASDRDTMARQVQALHLRVFGKRIAVDGPEVEANLELWQELYELEHDPAEAWTGLLAVLLRDPTFLWY